MSTLDEEMIEVRYFKAARRSHRFKENQKVWILHRSIGQSDALDIKYRYRGGKNRMVEGRIGINDTAIGEIKTTFVTEEFWRRLQHHNWLTAQGNEEHIKDLINGVYDSKER